MDVDAPAAVGPLFGPNFLKVIVADDNSSTKYSLQIYPDANNRLLKQNHLATHYYFLPQRVYLAKKQDSPKDYDLSMTVFKGLMTSEDTVGISATTPGAVEAGGGFCTFSTTFAIPDWVIKKAIESLKSKKFDAPIPPDLAAHTNYEQGDPEPRLGMVSISSNDVTIEVPQFGNTSGNAAPFLISAQGTGKGSIEAKGISSFLVTCNQLAAGAVAGALKAGASPFTVHYNLTELFYIQECNVTIKLDYDKCYEAYSAALGVGLIVYNASMQAAYTSAVANGGITTTITTNDAQMSDDAKKFITQNVKQMQDRAEQILKKEFLDYTPTDPGAPAQAGGFGYNVSVKANYQRHAGSWSESLTLKGTIAVKDTKSGDLSDVQSAVKANLNKYLTIVDIGEYFKKIQVAASSAINWDEKLPDGTNLADPLSSAMISVSYPDYSQPIDANKKPNLKTLAQGYHYMLGGTATGQEGLAQWNAGNAHDIVNISYLRLDKPVNEWPADQVKITKTLVFDGNDPRVDLANNKTTVVVESTGSNHTPVLSAAEVGYVFARFLVRPLPANVKLMLTTSLGPRKDTMTITPQNQNNIIWEIFSDKYFAQTSFTYSVQVEVTGPDFTDTPIRYSSAQPITVDIPSGRIKYVNAVSLQLPDAPADQKAQINDYIRRYQLQPANA